MFKQLRIAIVYINWTWQYVIDPTYKEGEHFNKTHIIKSQTEFE